jgi:hypothetical protein
MASLFTDKKQCIGALMAEIDRHKDNPPERKAACEVFLAQKDRIFKIHDLEKWKKSDDDPIIRKAINLRDKLPEDIKKDWPTPICAIRTPNYKDLWSNMGDKPSLWIEHDQGNVYLHLHPHSAAFHFGWADEGLKNFLKYTGVQVRKIVDSPKDQFGHYSTLYAIDEKE